MDQRPASGSAPRVRRRNLAGVFPRAFMCLWLTFLALGTYVALRDGDRTQQAVVGLFWLFGLPVAVHLFRQPLVWTEVAADGTLLVTRHKGLSFSRTLAPPGAYPAPTLEEDEDSDGAPYFRCVLDVAGERVVVAEGHGRAEMELIRQALADALRPAA